jgi:hypothetical protein
LTHRSRSIFQPASWREAKAAASCAHSKASLRMPAMGIYTASGVARERSGLRAHRAENSRKSAFGPLQGSSCNLVKRLRTSPNWTF